MSLTPRIAPPALVFFSLSDILNLKKEGDIHREEKGSMIMGLLIGGRGGGMIMMMTVEMGGMVK